MKELRTSIIIPAFNREKLVCRAAESALRASGPGDEVIVVDDGSSDGTLAALSSLRDRIRIIAAPHRGAGATRNRGIAEATGDLVAFLDSDDEWIADHLTVHRQVHAVRDDVAFSFSNFYVEDAEGVVFHNFLPRWHHDPRPWSEILSPSISIAGASVYIGDLSLPEFQSDYVPTFTMVAKRRALPDTRWFAEDVPTYEDLQCFGRLTFAGMAAYIDQETAKQYGHSAPRLTDAPMLKKVESRIKILERVWRNDAAFTAKYPEAIRERFGEQLLLLAGCLILAGRTHDARTVIQQRGGAPWAYKLLSWMPGPFARRVVQLAARVKGL